MPKKKSAVREPQSLPRCRCDRGLQGAEEAPAEEDLVPDGPQVKQWVHMADPSEQHRVVSVPSGTEESAAQAPWGYR